MCYNLLGFSRTQPWLNSLPGGENSFQGRGDWHSLHSFSLLSGEDAFIAPLKPRTLFDNTDISFIRITILHFFWCDLCQCYVLQRGFTSWYKVLRVQHYMTAIYLYLSKNSIGPVMMFLKYFSLTAIHFVILTWQWHGLLLVVCTSS